MDLKKSQYTIASEASKKLIDMRKQNRKIRTYDIILITALILAGALFFFSYSRTIDESSWIAPLITFSIYIATFFTLTLTAGKKKFALFATIASIATSLLFIQDPLHIISILLASLFAWRSIVLIRNGLFSTLKITVGRALHMGAMPFVLALALVISSQYYFTISKYDSATLVQRVVGSNTSATISITSKIMSFLKSDEDKSKEPATVDTYLKNTFLSSQDDSSENSQTASLFDTFTQSIGIDATAFAEKTNLLPDFQEQIETSLLDITRLELSQSLGINLTGSERITDVLGDLAKIRALKLVEENKSLSSAIPLILTILLFLALISIGSLLKFFWIFLGQAIFWLLKFYGVIKTIYIKKDVEVIKF